MSQHTTVSESAALRSEHDLLDREIADWRTWWHELREMGKPNFGGMGDRLTQFRSHLAAHFAHEESQHGLSLVAGLPNQSLQRLAGLRDQHAGLMAELDRLIARLQSCQPDFEILERSTRHEFEAFLGRLHDHESAEEEVLSRLTA